MKTCACTAGCAPSAARPAHGTCRSSASSSRAPAAAAATRTNHARPHEMNAQAAKRIECVNDFVVNRPDVNVIGVPLTQLCATRYTDPRERQLLKNIVYVGVLAALLGIEPEVIASLLGEQYKGKAKLIQPNLDAFMMGLHHGRDVLDADLGLKVERRDAV